MVLSASPSQQTDTEGAVLSRQSGPAVAARAEHLAAYPMAVLQSKAAARKKQGLSVIDLSSGNPMFTPSTKVVTTMVKEWESLTNYAYPGYEPLPVLAESLASWYEQSCLVSFADKQVVLTAGAKEGIWLSYLVLFNPGDEVLIPNPGYPAYGELARLFGVVPVQYAMSAPTGFVPTIAELEARCTARTKGIWLNYPGNPTGATISSAQLAELTEWAAARGLWILSDHAYAQVCFDGSTAPSAFTSPTVASHVVELGSASKMLSMAGVRLGWLSAHHTVAAKFQAVQSQLSSGLPKPHQLATVAGLRSLHQGWHEKMLAQYAGQRNWVAALLTKLGVDFEVPQASLYIWGKVPASFDAAAFASSLPESSSTSQQLSRGELYAEWLLTTYGLVVVPGITFGSEGAEYIRASYSHQLNKEVLLHALE